jgi:hypothetical protein
MVKNFPIFPSLDSNLERVWEFFNIRVLDSDLTIFGSLDELASVKALTLRILPNAISL